MNQEKKFKNEFRVASARMQSWDYGKNAAYHVIICTKNKNHLFGQVVEYKMQLNDLGVLAEKFWLEIPAHFSFVKLDELAVMPNHVHGIIIIDKPKETIKVETPKLGVSTHWKPGVLGVIINQYKRICTIHARKINPEFAWQPRFYEHIIRDRQDFLNAVDYIRDNPKNWQKDEYFE